jgi:hypothetical protein
VRDCTGLDEPTVRGAIDCLSGEGFIYSAADDYHWKASF